MKSIFVLTWRLGVWGEGWGGLGLQVWEKKTTVTLITPPWFLDSIPGATQQLQSPEPWEFQHSLELIYSGRLLTQNSPIILSGVSSRSNTSSGRWPTTWQEAFLGSAFLKFLTVEPPLRLFSLKTAEQQHGVMCKRSRFDPPALSFGSCATFALPFLQVWCKSKIIIIITHKVSISSKW